MFIQTEATPNPNVTKFLPGQDIIEGNPLDFKSKDSAAKASPFAERLFGIDGVEGVFLSRDYVSITKGETLDWIKLKPLILAVIMDHVGGGLPILHEAEATRVSAIDEDLDEISKQIVELIDTRIRPAVAQDGGDIEFAGFEDGVVYVYLRGACAGCPSATLTLKSGIENMLKHFVPEVTEVREHMM